MQTKAFADQQSCAQQYHERLCKASRLGGAFEHTWANLKGRLGNCQKQMHKFVVVYQCSVFLCNLWRACCHEPVGKFLEN